MAPKNIVLAAVKAIFTDFDADAAGKLLHPGYIQHNPGVPTGAAPILGFIPALKESGIRTTIHRVIAEGDLVVLHATYENAHAFGAPTLVAFDLFRVENGLVVEHWDNLQAPGAPNPSGRTMTDGPTQISDRDLTAANKALVDEFVRAVLIGGQPARAPEFISTTTYLQHNPMVADGLSSLGEALVALASNGMAMRYLKAHRILAEGDMVFVMSEGLMGKTPTAFFDLFRVADGKIVEHWDTMAEIPAQMAHSNGKF
ncbi:MAG: nuclear transport factor 2 family protein [Beijerinckiaceae bacterium]|nr:nuclear transport factor 2 family protein [Beijerinckiaceae bacterium]